MASELIDGFDAGSVVAVHAVALVPAAAAVVRSLRFPKAAALDSWMAGHGLEGSGPGRAVVAHYLHRTRWIRSIGFVAGWAVVPLGWLWATRSAYDVGSPIQQLMSAVIVAGAFLAAALLPTPAGDGSVTATAPRRRASYVPAFTRTDPLWIAAAFVALAAVRAALGLSTTALAIPVGVAVVAWAATVAGQRLVIERPQRNDDLEMLRVDDAIRSTNATNLCGFAYAGSLVALGLAAGDLASSGAVIDAAKTLLYMASGALILLGPGLWLGFMSLDGRWIVPRLRRPA